MKEFYSNSWCIKYPSNWIHENTPECESFYNPNGVGTLQISCAIKENNITEEEILNFARDHLVKSNDVASTQLGDFDSITFTYLEDNNYWRLWYLKMNSILLYITYNCNAIEKKKLESLDIDSILSTLKKHF